jgi:hypothetical protein
MVGRYGLRKPGRAVMNDASALSACVVQRNAHLGRNPLSTCLNNEVLMCASQPTQVDEHLQVWQCADMYVCPDIYTLLQRGTEDKQCSKGASMARSPRRST